MGATAGGLNAAACRFVIPRLASAAIQRVKAIIPVKPAKPVRPAPVEPWTTRMSLAAKYRPQTFGDVWGQPTVVRVLSSLIQRRVGASILLHGAVGSGKTTMARIYGRGLNCSAPSADGSPCLSCQHCAASDKEIGFYEYDVPARGGTWHAIDNWLRTDERNPRNSKGFVVYFLDEAHRLEREAAEGLLKRIEDEDETRRQVFVFATTEPGRLSAALRSRLIELEVRPLDLETSVRFVSQVARDAEIAFDPAVVRLLAGLKNGHPRNLLFGLEQLQSLGNITLAEARRHFDVDHLEVLRNYVAAVADMDFGEALSILNAWNEEGRDKVSFVHALLLSTYFNDILRRPLQANPLLDSLTAGERAHLLAPFLKLFGATSPVDLRPYWLEMMRFWRTSQQAPDEEAALLLFADFHILLAELAERKSEAVERAAVSSQSENSISPLAKPPVLKQVNGPGHGFITQADVARVINYASYLPQLHGVWFNSRVKLGPILRNDINESEARKLHEQFWIEFEDRVDVSANPSFARLSVAEREDGGFVSYSALHIPAAGGAEILQELRTWARNWRSRTQDAELVFEFDVKLETAPPKIAKFHWGSALLLCGGMAGNLRDQDSDGSERDLRDLIGLPRTKKMRRDPSRLQCDPIVTASGGLSEAAIELASRLSMAPISAFDAKAWGHLRDGWEIEEYRDRRVETARRAQALRIAELAGATPEDLALIQASWEGPLYRPRQWRGWWQTGRGV
ncbi:hypothetical protein C6569_19640 [Phreatobacter cathodiphilus]|jgi:DNA polymerase III subunit gamma/tau|uniref:AAA+ ATPase domain-containing protein n=2 Tax=Phreatobacter cathodiphilus TaxID=1868589 RepID=A0A2S0NGQ4_9HYPH|nr:hypothetical protein C6569_19640 [Phreatobacter cathodiphilus]